MTRSRLSTPRQLTLRYLFALGLLGVLAVVNYRMFRAEIKEGEASAAIQQVSGRHRLLFQQCVVLAEQFVHTDDPAERSALRARLLQLVSELESVHYRLIQFDTPRLPLDAPPKPDAVATAQSKVQHIYFDAPWLLDTEVRNYIAQIHALTKSEPEELSPANPHLRYARNVALSDHVTGALDAVVAAYQEQSEAKTSQLRQAAYGSLVGTYMVLVLTGLFVFRPMARRVREEMDALEDLNQTLEQRVSERTALAEQHARELEESEAALRSQTRILWSILDSMGDGVVVADRESDFQLMNRAARRLLNVDTDSRPDVRAEDWTKAFGVTIYRSDQITPYPHEELPLTLAMNGRTVTRADLFLRREAEPREMWVSVTARPVIDDDGGVHGGVTVWRDSTERKLAERRMLQSERLAAIGQMVAGVAHESRNALQKIEACTQLLRWRLNGSADGEVEELINDIQQAEERLHRLFEDLRGFAAPMRLERRRCDVSEVLRKAWDAATSLANGSVALLEEEKHTSNLYIMADPFQLEQVFRNLFENSLAACRPRTFVKIDFEEVQNNGESALCVRVQDNGPGLSPEARVRIFEPFFTTKAEGTGLGTAIIRRIVTAHNGRVELEQDHRPGAAFRIILPREET